MLCSIKTTDTLSQPITVYHQQRDEALAFNLTKANKDRDLESKLKYKVLKHAQNKVFVITAVWTAERELNIKQIFIKQI